MKRSVLLLSALAIVLLSFGLVVLPLASNANVVTLGTWNSTTAYPRNIANQSCAISAGYIYCVGGNTGTGGTNAVYYARSHRLA